MSRDEIAQAWDQAPTPEKKAIANYDEDGITMAVAAGMDCIAAIDPKSIDGLYFASTTSLYKEKQAAATVAAAMDMRREAFTADFSGSLIVGVNTMRVKFAGLRGFSTAKRPRPHSLISIR